MNNLPSASSLQGQLDRLRGAIRDFASRAEKIIREHQSRTQAEAKAYDTQTQQAAAATEAGLAEAQAAYEAAKARSQADFLRRKARINQAHIAVRSAVIGDITGEEGRRKYRIQERALRAERKRDEDLANAAAAFQQIQQQLADIGERFTGLEAKAQAAMTGYRTFRRLLAHDRAWPGGDPAPDESRLVADLEALHGEIDGKLKRFRRYVWPQVFRFLPIWLVVVLLLAAGAAVPLLQRMGVEDITWQQTGIACAILLALAVGYWQGRTRAGPTANAIASGLARARRLHRASVELSELRYQQEQQRIHDEFDATNRALSLEWKQTIKGALDLRGVRPMEVDEQAQRAYRTQERLLRSRLERIESGHARAIASLRAESEARARELTTAHDREEARLHNDQEQAWQRLEAEWRQTLEPIYRTLQEASATAETLFPPWDSPAWASWQPSADFKNAAKFGELGVHVPALAEVLPADKRLSLPGPADLILPLALTYPLEGSILFEAAQGGHEQVIQTLNAILFRLLATTPPGKLSFTILDPVGLGENFAALMHLADFEASSINSRIWTQTNQIEEKLAELNEHMEKVIQMYLRNEYPTIAEYNARAGTIAEKYHYLVIASFPANFSDTAARRLRNIAASGARCGVYTLVHWDQRLALPHDFVPDELRKNSVGLVNTEAGFQFSDWRQPGIRLSLDAPPSPEFATRFLKEVGRSGKDQNRVEVPFSQVAPEGDRMWGEETTEAVRVPIGRSGATKFQYLEMGRGTRQHALIAGKTGSGKSTLFHVIITNLALWCGPDQVEFYLVDFKKGVEFKCYASRRLPHAKVVAIESDREFGLSVLHKVDAELRRRGDLFRQLGVQDLAGYKRSGGTEPMPRSLLIIDEFQEFFTEEDRISQGAAVLLDRIVRQGRAFGIHVLLGSQTLGGAYTLARATIGQMVIRIALQCNEADAYLIMDQDNPAPRLLSRPGEGIYNDTSGTIEGNNPFQTVWLPEDERDRYLAQVRERADRQNGRFPGPFVFEGNAPADVRENLLLRSALEAKPPGPPARALTWFGAPNSIKGPTEAVFQRQSGSNLLIVGQSEERSQILLAVALVSLAAQYPAGGVRFILLDSTPPGSPQRDFLQEVLRAIPQETVQVNNSNMSRVLGALAEDIEERAGESPAEAPATFVLIQGLQNYKKLRQEDEFSFSGGDSGEDAKPAAALLSLITDGPSHGVHVIAACDTYNNVNRFLGRKLLTEFEMRVLFQMSASDSASLIEAPDASLLGLHRALFYNDREGYTETFRPYALPGRDWIEEITRHLKNGPHSV